MSKPKPIPKGLLKKKKFPVGISNNKPLVTNSIFLPSDRTWAKYSIRLQSLTPAHRTASTTGWISSKDRFRIKAYVERRGKNYPLIIYTNELFINREGNYEVLLEGNGLGYLLSDEPIVFELRNIHRKEFKNGTVYVWSRRLAAMPEITVKQRKRISIIDRTAEEEDAVFVQKEELRELVDEEVELTQEDIEDGWRELYENDKKVLVKRIPQRRMRFTRLGIRDRITKRVTNRSMRAHLVDHKFTYLTPEFEHLLS